MKISLETLYTPYTLDAYQTFTLEKEQEYLIEYLIDEGKIKDENEVDLTFKTDEYLKDLAANLVVMLKDEILDDVILGISSDLKVISPKYYNYTTDKIWLDFEVDKRKLNKFIKDNKEDYEKDKIGSCSGFMWLGDEADTMLEYYLNKVSAAKYTPDMYYYDQLDCVEGSEYIDYEIIKK